MSAFEATSSHLGRLSSALEQQSLVSGASPPPKEAQSLPGNLSPAMPSPGSLFLTPPGSLGGPSLWIPAPVLPHPGSQLTGTLLSCLTLKSAVPTLTAELSLFPLWLSRRRMPGS